ncbi:MAG: sigma-54-dependent Fis family transcriptional regulator [Nitrospirae bacterium]|nr:sigma-54-dependent Fis family transcriptional regulator [Nitrospirota bacterium]
MSKTLVIDDEKDVREALSAILADNGFANVTSSCCHEALDVVSKQDISAIILDLNMPGIDGIETMRRIKKIKADVPIIFLTAYGDISTAVEAMKLGASDFMAKPPDFKVLFFKLQRAIELNGTNDNKESPDEQFKGNNGNNNAILGSSTAIKKTLTEVKRVAATDFSVFIEGETGTGKTFTARFIHDLSKRMGKPFVKVDIGSFQETVIESELFGHEKGSFTGADKTRQGYFEIANGGTIFLDEVQNMSPYVQSKLLSVIEDKKITRLGSTTPIDIDVRVISATNQDIKKCVAEKQFREDLFYRLCEIPIKVPPLRERVEDIPYLAYKFLSEVSGSIDQPVREISASAMSALKNHAWVGNARELRNVIRRACLMAIDGVIRPEHIAFPDNKNCSNEESPSSMSLKEIMRKEEAKLIQKVLAQTHGNKSKAASILQISYRGLMMKCKEFNIK